jgi:hypothetical protein
MVLGNDMYEARVVPHIVVVPIYVPLPSFIYFGGWGPSWLQGRSSGMITG